MVSQALREILVLRERGCVINVYSSSSSFDTYSFMYTDGFSVLPVDRGNLELLVPEERTVQRDQRVASDPLARSEPLEQLERR